MPTTFSPTGSRELPFQGELEERVAWLIRLRWLAVLGMSITVLVSTIVFQLLVNPALLLSIASFILAYNLVFLFIYRQIRNSGNGPGLRKKLLIFANLQISLDLITLTVLIHLSGGAENLFFFFFIFHMVIAGILLSSRDSYVQAGLATLLFNLMLLLEWSGILPHHGLFPGFPRPLYFDPAFLGMVSVVFTSTLFISVYMATSIIKRLRQREQELVSLKDYLQETNEELCKVHEYRSRLILKVEHELKAPLAAIQSLITVVLTSFGSTLQPKVVELLTRAEKRIHGLLRMVRQLLELSRMRTSSYLFNLQAVDFIPIIEHQLEAIQTQAEQKGLTLKKNVPNSLPRLHADPQALEEVLVNLLSNAVKYTERGGVSLEAAPAGRFVRLSVSDTGMGMTDQDKFQVFEEFFRSSQAKENYEGTGLGLAIVKEIVEGHGGSIEIESTPGQGSRFTVLWPVFSQKK